MARHRLIMGAVAREAAFKEGELGYHEGLRREAAAAFEEIVDFARAAAFPAGEGDVRVKGAALGLEAILLADALDLRGEGSDGRLGLHAGPQGTAAALFEAAETGDVQLECVTADPCQRGREIVG